MKRYGIKTIIFLSILIITFFFCIERMGLFAQSITSTDNLDVVLVLDSSGSMRSNDPYNLRIEAAKLFISLSNQGDKIGIVEFSDDAKILKNLTEINEISKSDLKTVTSKINSKGRWTNITQSLDVSYQMMNQYYNKRNKPAIILLTDGFLDLENDQQEILSKEILLNQILPKFKENIWPIFTIALSGGCDFSLLEDIASKTGGGFYKINSSNQLMETYFNIFSDLGGLFVHKFQKDKRNFDNYTLYSDGNIDQFIVAIVPQKGMVQDSKNLMIINPNNENVIDNLPQEISRNYKVILIPQPIKGNWKIQAFGKEELEIFLGEKLAFYLRIRDLYDLYNKGDTIKIATEVFNRDDGSRVTNQNLISGINISATIQKPDGINRNFLLYDDGRHDDDEALDGLLVYPYTETDIIGNYSILIQGFVNIGNRKIPTTTYQRIVKVSEYIQLIGPDKNDSLNLKQPIIVAMYLLNENGDILKDNKILSKSKINVLISNPKLKVDTLTAYDDGNFELNGDEKSHDFIYTIKYTPYQPGRHFYHVEAVRPFVAKLDTIKSKENEFYVKSKEKFIEKVLGAIIDAMVEHIVKIIIVLLGIIISSVLFRSFKKNKMKRNFLSGTIEIFKKVPKGRPELLSSLRLDTTFPKEKEIIIGRKGPNDRANKITLNAKKLKENHVKLIAHENSSILVKTMNKDAKMEVDGISIKDYILMDQFEIEIESFIIKYNAPISISEESEKDNSDFERI